MSSTKVASCNTPTCVTQVNTVLLHAVPIVSLLMNGQERLCLAQISNTLLKGYSYNEIHNRRVALGITCVQCTPVQLEMLRRAGAMPISSRRCGMITRREAERLVKSFLEDTTPPKLPDDFAFDVEHSCGWGCCGAFVPSRYNSSRAKCIRCRYCDSFFSPNKFIFHYHRNAIVDANGATTSVSAVYNHPDAANFNSWRRHLKLVAGSVSSDAVLHAWEDVKAMFNGGNRRRIQHLPPHQQHHHHQQEQQQRPHASSTMHLPIGSASVAAADERLRRQHRPHSHTLPRPQMVPTLAHHHHPQQFRAAVNHHHPPISSAYPFPSAATGDCSRGLTTITGGGLSETNDISAFVNSAVTVANFQDVSDIDEGEDVRNICGVDDEDANSTENDDVVMNRSDTTTVSFEPSSVCLTPSTGPRPLSSTTTLTPWTGPRPLSPTSALTPLTPSTGPRPLSPTSALTPLTPSTGPRLLSSTTALTPSTGPRPLSPTSALTPLTPSTGPRLLSSTTALTPSTGPRPLSPTSALTPLTPSTGPRLLSSTTTIRLPQPPLFIPSPVVQKYRFKSETECTFPPAIILPSRPFSDAFSIPPSFIASLPPHLDSQSVFGSSSSSSPAVIGSTIVRPKPIVASASNLQSPVYHNQTQFPQPVFGGGLAMEPVNESVNESSVARATPDREPDDRCPVDDRSSQGDVEEASSYGCCSETSSSCIDVDTVDDDIATTDDVDAVDWPLRLRENSDLQKTTHGVTSQLASELLPEQAKGRLENLLKLEMETRRAMEMNYKEIKDKLASEADFERRQRKNLERQLQLVKGSLYLELDQERKSRLILERQLINAQHSSRYVPMQPYSFPAPIPAWRSLMTSFDIIHRAIARDDAANELSSSGK